MGVTAILVELHERVYLYHLAAKTLGVASRHSFESCIEGVDSESRQAAIPRKAGTLGLLDGEYGLEHKVPKPRTLHNADD